MTAFPRLTLRILSPDGISIEKTELTSISIPLADGGGIGIKPGHAPLIAETVRGTIRFNSELGEDSIEVHPGVLEIRENSVIILSAGKVTQQSDFVSEPAQVKFERLMQTLVSKLQPDEETDSAQNQHD